ncbi:MAG: hypothetical protein ACFFG0_01750 [Candidatus Thorarchaeota archaeon]
MRKLFIQDDDIRYIILESFFEEDILTGIRVLLSGGREVKQHINAVVTIIIDQNLINNISEEKRSDFINDIKKRSKKYYEGLRPVPWPNEGKIQKYTFVIDDLKKYKF